MSVGPSPVRCDECGKLKGAANKWPTGWETDASVGVSETFLDQDDPQRRDWCSEKCAIAAVSRKIEEIRKREAARPGICASSLAGMNYLTPAILLRPHSFTFRGGAHGTADRDCDVCGLPDRDSIHHNADGSPIQPDRLAVGCSIRIFNPVTSELPFSPYLVAAARVYGPDEIEITPQGAVAVKLRNGTLVLKPDEFEWVPRSANGETPDSCKQAEEIKRRAFAVGLAQYFRIRSANVQQPARPSHPGEER